jgi:hypothetical protein
MAWTYDLSKLSDATLGPRYQVRFLVQDTNTNRQLVQDEEIDWTLSQAANVYTAAADICDSLVARAAGVQTRKVGDLTLTYDPKFYRELAATLRARGASDQIPFFGGQSISGKEANQNDTDAVSPAFAIGLDDNPAAPSPSTLAPTSPLVRVP